ncbi:MAG: hypothetical protein V9E87_05070 [Gemmatimonadales bacterium]
MTLLELLLVLALLGIVGSMVTAMVTAASRMGARAVTQLAAERTTQVAATFFRHALAAATWPERGCGRRFGGPPAARGGGRGVRGERHGALDPAGRLDGRAGPRSRA